MPLVMPESPGVLHKPQDWGQLPYQSGWAGEVEHHPAGGEAAVCLVGAAQPCVDGVVYALVPQAGHHAVVQAKVVG